MGERHDLPKIKPDEKPTIVNHEAAKWGWLSGIGAIFIAIPMVFSDAFKYAKEHIGGSTDHVKLEEGMLSSTKKMFGLIVSAEIVGAIIGGIQGKQKQENEQAAGRVVKTPSYWNTGIISGMFVSSVVQAPFNFLKIEESLAKPPRTRFIPMAIGIAAPIIGSIWRKNELQRDFDKSVAIRDANHAKTQQLLEAAIAQQQTPAAPTMDEPPSFKDSVTPDEAALLMEKQAQATPPVVEKPAHGPHHPTHHAEAATSEAQGAEHHAAHGEHHDAPSHAAKHEPHTGSHAAKHEPAQSHTDHAEKPEASMAMSA